MSSPDRADGTGDRRRLASRLVPVETDHFGQEFKSLLSPQDPFAPTQSGSDFPPDPCRLLVVANRLPMSVKKSKETGQWTASMSSGGLVSAMLGVKNMSMIWIGWPGTEIEEPKDRVAVKILINKDNCEPVFLKQSLIDQYYSGFSNKILWPLFHYIPLVIDDLQNAEQMFEAYEAANQTFANAILKIYRPGDIVWVHDYHLMLLPALLRTAMPTMKIAFFLHTPFPSSEIYRILPQREEILRGILSSDLIGFHVYDYSRHFKSCCTRILGLDTLPEGVDIGNAVCVVDAFPIGIDPDRFIQAVQSAAVRARIAILKDKFADWKVIVGIDRLDYIKGIPNKIHALERFFVNNPKWIGRVVLVQIAIPSRTDVPEYQRLAKETHELVGKVNGRFGSLSYVPIHYLDQSICFDEMCALYCISDVCLITSLRDGMNLVSYEYIASQSAEHGTGALILSEFCGAAQSLGAGSIRINPWDIEGVAHAIQYALEMSPAEREEYHSYAIRYVNTHSSQHWAESFIQDLQKTRNSPEVPIVPRRLGVENLITQYVSCKRHRVIIMGLVGTLAQKRQSGMSYDRFQRFAKCSASTLASLKTLSSDRNTSVLVLTSRNKVMCSSVLGDRTPAYIAAENGYFLKRTNSTVWENMQENIDFSWMDEVARVFEYFAERTPGSFVEREETFLSWHYGDADPEFAERQSRDLLNHLVAGPLVNTSTEVINSHKLVQVRPAGITKGNMATKIMSIIQAEHPPVGFVVCIGDFLGRDDDLFTNLIGAPALGQNQASPRGQTLMCLPVDCHVCTVNVGAKAGQARFFVRNATEVEQVLEKLSLTIDPYF